MDTATEKKINLMDSLLKKIFEVIPEYNFEDWSVFQYNIEPLYMDTILYVLDTLEIPRFILAERFNYDLDELITILQQTYYAINLDKEYIEFYKKVKDKLKEYNIFII